MIVNTRDPKLFIMFESRQYHYASSSDALKQLKNKGYNLDFNLLQNQIIEYPDDFIIVYIYKYEGESNPEDASIVYGIERLSNGDRGVFVMGNPAYDTTDASQILNLLPIEGRVNQKRGNVN